MSRTTSVPAIYNLCFSKVFPHRVRFMDFAEFWKVNCFETIRNSADDGYILDNPHLFNGANVLDFGCGCGSASVAASMVGSCVIANDIDTNALIATKINYRLNSVSVDRTQFISDNMLYSTNITTQDFLTVKKSFIVLGDMFYDTEFAEKVLTWLKKLKDSTGTRVLIGDPNRHPLAEEQLRRYKIRVEKKHLATYSLPDFVMREHYGFSGVNVIELQ